MNVTGLYQVSQGPKIFESSKVLGAMQTMDALSRNL